MVEPQVKLEYRWLEFRNRINQELSLPNVVATVASAIVFDYEEFLEEGIALQQAT